MVVGDKSLLQQACCNKHTKKVLNLIGYKVNPPLMFAALPHSAAATCWL
jgi:hypothetical protein